jgi:hypothetical protein
MSQEYADRWISCDENGLKVRSYYLWGAKTIPYSSINGVQRVDLSALKGKLRIWGTSNMSYWASLDPGRPKKDVGMVLDLGKRVKPFLTPDDVDTVIGIITAHTGLEPTTGSSPFV